MGPISSRCHYLEERVSLAQASPLRRTMVGYIPNRALHNSLQFLFCEFLFGCVGLKLNVTPPRETCFQFRYGTARL